MGSPFYEKKVSERHFSTKFRQKSVFQSHTTYVYVIFDSSRQQKSAQQVEKSFVKQIWLKFLLESFKIRNIEQLK